MNRKFLYRSSIVLFFFACTEDEHISLTNPFDPNNLNIAYKLDLQSNSGANLDSVTISWRQTDVDMKITDTDANEITISGNSYTCCHSPFVGMSPGEFRDFSFSITIDPTTYEDVFQIYSRPVQPVMNFEYNIQPRWETDGRWDEGEEYTDGNDIWDEGEEYIDGNNVYDVGEDFTDSNNGNWDPWEEYVDGNGIWDEGEEYVDSNNGKWDPWEIYFDSNNGNWDPWEEYVDGIEVYDRKLEWQVTEEPQDASSKYFIYRVPKENVADLLTPESCDSCLITTLTSFSVASYTDSDSLILTEFEEQTFYYLVQVSTKNGYTRNSFIHYNDFPQPEGTSLNYVSQNKDEYIEIKWTSITESDYFYQYEILRTLGSPEQGNDTLIVAIIPNIEIDHFMDRSEELLGGTTYYYSIAVVDINGRKQHSDFIRGYSNP